MATMNKNSVGLALGLTVAALATPSFGKSRSKEQQTIEARAAAIHECSDKAAKYKMNTWQTTQFAIYGTCMAAHGQRL